MFKQYIYLFFTNFKSRVGILLLVLLLIFSQKTLLAQDDGSAVDLAVKISDAQANNLKSLMNYSWKMSTNIEVESELKLVILTQFRFNTEGKLESTQLSNEWKVEKKKFVAGKKQKSAMEENQKVAEEAYNLLKQYIFMSKGQLVDFYEKANISKSSEEGTIVLEANSVLVKDDNVVQSVDEKTFLTHSMIVKSILSTNNMTGTIKLETLEDGTSRPVQLIVEIPTKNLKIVMENFDFIFQK
jgi:hypothetical protein